MPPILRHTLAPVYDEQSRVLILGSFPSPKSREIGFYYGNPQNRFWPVLATLFDEPLPAAAEERRAFALRHHLALWDVIASCAIRGADDGSIRAVTPNDLGIVLSRAPIAAVFTCGSKAHSLYNKYCLPATGRTAIALPSTSPANCRYYDFPRLVEAYRILLHYL